LTCRSATATICYDKTSTLTENKMRAVVLDVAGHTTDITELCRHGHPVLEAVPQGTLPALEQAILLAAGTLCNDAVLQPHRERPGEMTTIGDPTEGAIIVAAAQFGLLKSRLDEAFPRVAEAPFSSERKRMTTVHRAANPMGAPALDAVWRQNGVVAFVKGSTDGISNNAIRSC